MRISTVTTTPNPNSMMLKVADAEAGWPASGTYSGGAAERPPDFVAGLLAVPGVRSVFLGPGFITLSRDPSVEWAPILAAAATALGETADTAPPSGDGQRAATALGEVHVAVQTFRGVPMQVKATAESVEERVGLPPRFADAVHAIRNATDADFLRERRWDARGARYGPPAAVAAAMAEELDAVIDERDLARLVAVASCAPTPPPEAPLADLASDDWRQRLRAVQHLGTNADAIPLLVGALADAQPQIRRMAAASLGGTGHPDAVAPLCATLDDPDVGVRRTVGDALSDLGDPAAEPAMCLALEDPNKLVRWRAARFLAEVGTAAAVPALEVVLDDPEFEVRLEVAAALARIRGGEPGEEPVWRKITRAD